MSSLSLAWKHGSENPKAFASLRNVPQDIRHPRFLAYRAALLLAVGRVDEAEADIARALFSSTEPYLVITGGNPTTVEVTVRPVRGR